VQPLFDGSRLRVEIQGVLSLLPRNTWHVGGLPCEDVPIGSEEGGERVFLCRVELRPDQRRLVRLIVLEGDSLDLLVRLQLGTRDSALEPSQILSDPSQI